MGELAGQCGNAEGVSPGWVNLSGIRDHSRTHLWRAPDTRKQQRVTQGETFASSARRVTLRYKGQGKKERKANGSAVSFSAVFFVWIKMVSFLAG